MSKDRSFTWTNQSHARASGGGSVVGRDQRNTGDNVRRAKAGRPHATPPAPSQAGTTATGRTRILLLAANPDNTPRLALDEEAREITEQLRLAQIHDRFELITCPAVRPADILPSLNRHRPHIVHVSGHGDRSGEIVLSSSERGDQRVSAAALAEVFRTAKDDIRIVVLNACFSTAQAQAISRHIDYTIGMRAPVDDRSAIVFAAAFYSALAFRRTVVEAFDQAKAAIMVHGLPGHGVPELIIRPGADPYASPPPPRPSSGPPGEHEH